MSTNAVIAEPFGDGWRGRHSQWDGYPTSVGRHLWAIAQRDGVKSARHNLVRRHYGWSTIDSDRLDLTGVRKPTPEEYASVEYHSPEYYAFHFDDDGRYENVPGYGVAWTNKKIDHFGKPYQQVKKTDWIHSERPGDYGGEWAYVLTDTVLWVLKICFVDLDDDEAVLLGTYRWDEAQPDWEAVEKLADAD